MKICQLLLSHGDGGLEKHVRDLSIQLLMAGHQVSVIGHHDFLKTLPSGIERYPVSANAGRLNLLLNLQVLSLLRKIKADIVHAQAGKAVSVLNHIRFFAPSTTIGTLHNIKRSTRLYQKLDHVIAVSHQLATPFSADKCSVVYNGIEIQKFKSRNLQTEFDLPANKPVLVAVGRLVKAKGFDMLLDAVDGLDINLLIIGDGPDKMALEEHIDKLDPITCVRLLGQRHDVPTILAAADGVLISSRREGFSYVFSEAVLSGCRVLATDVPVANEVLPTELISPVDNAKDFRQRLVSLLASKEKWSALMQSPFNIAKQTMTLEAMREQTLATYQQLLAKRTC